MPNRYSKPFDMQIDPAKSYTATIETNRGVIVLQLHAAQTPRTVNNFVSLARDGYYDGVTFHRVIPDFMIQGGCPNGNGTGGPGYTINCETTGVKQIHDRGVMSMAHRGRNTGGSQFFICHNRSNTKHLDGVHTCFGKVTEGLDVVDDIRGGDVIKKIILT